MELTITFNLDKISDISNLDFNETFDDDFLIQITRNKIGPSQQLRDLAVRFTDYYQDFLYDPEINGEKGILDKLSKLPFTTVFDVGANVGDWSLMASKIFSAASIHTFEISDATFQTLENKLRAAAFRNNHLGLSNGAGSIEYKDYGTNSPVNTIITRSNFHDPNITPELRTVNVVTGDHYCKMHNIDSIDFLKIDVEGAEHLVLLGFEQMLTAGKLRCIQFEYGYVNGDAKFLMRDFYELLNSRDYVVGKLWSDGVGFTDFHYQLNDFKSGPNYIAVHKNDTEVISLLQRTRSA